MFFSVHFFFVCTFFFFKHRKKEGVMHTKEKSGGNKVA